MKIKVLNGSSAWTVGEEVKSLKAVFNRLEEGAFSAAESFRVLPYERNGTHLHLNGDESWDYVMIDVKPDEVLKYIAKNYEGIAVEQE